MSPYSALSLVRQRITCGASFYDAFLEEFHTFFYVKVFHVPFVPQRQIPWSCFLSDHRDFPVAVRFQVSMPLLCSRAGSCPRRGAVAVPMVQTARRTIFFPSEHGGRRPCSTGRSGSFPRRGTEAAPMLQTVRLTHGHSTVAHHGGRCPCCAVLQFSSAHVEETVELTVALVENSSNGAAHHRDDELMV